MLKYLNMEGLIDQKGRERFFLVVLTVLYLCLVFLQTLVPQIAPKASFPPEIQFLFIKIESVVVIGCAIGLVQLLISVQLVLAGQKAGYWTQLGVNSFNFLFVIQELLLRKEFSAAPGIAISIVSVIVCTVVYNQHKRIQHTIDTLHRYAFIDDLTGLPNRKERVSTISDYMQGPSRVPAFSLLMFDFDNFKMINESLGHSIGDVMITEIVHNLGKIIKAPASIGRIGGDEFLVIIPESLSDRELELYAEKINQIVNQPFNYKDREYRLTASFGIARFPKDSINPVELMQQVDIALFRAKAHGKNQIEFFDEKMQLNLEHHIDIERKLAKAIEKGEIYVDFQPQYRVPGEKLRGFEVLARWASPTMGAISPQDFIPIAEENGYIVALGTWIMREACSTYQVILKDYPEAPMLAINISVIQLRDPEFLNTVRQVIEDTGIDTKNLEFEITESVCITSPEIATHIIKELKDMGITIALDDFGTGYSSLSYLRNLPLDVVKIDKSFVDMIGQIPDEKNIIKSIIDMAHTLDLEVIAEGIEHDNQLAYLVRNGCDIIQGNLLGKPAPMAAL